MRDNTIGIRKSTRIMYPKGLSQRIAERDLALRETVAFHAVHTTRSPRFKSSISFFLLNAGVFFLSLLFLAILFLVFDALPYLVFKIGALTTLVISMSYLSSVQVKRINRTRQRRKSPLPWVIQAPYGYPVGWEREDTPDDRQYLSLLKQDTAAYLSALKTKVLRKGVQ